MTTAGSYTVLKLTDAEDMAGGFGLSEMGEVRFPTDALDAEGTGLSHQRLRAGARQPFGHRHDEAEEVAATFERLLDGLRRAPAGRVSRSTSPG